VPEGLEAFEILEGPAIFAFGDDLVTHEQRPGVGYLAGGHAVEAFGEGVGAVLRLRDGYIAIADEVLGHADEEAAGGVEGFVEASGEEAAFEVRDAEHGLLGQSDALDGEQLLGIDGPVDGDKIGAEAGDFLEVFEADDGEVRGGKAVLAGVLGGAGLALGSAGASGMGRIGVIGGELFLGYGLAGMRWHGVFLPIQLVARRQAGVCRCEGQVEGKKRGYFLGKGEMARLGGAGGLWDDL
jgi:hypothetical protein